MNINVGDITDINDNYIVLMITKHRLGIDLFRCAPLLRLSRGGVC